jgi:hypothetical protein
MLNAPKSPNEKAALESTILVTGVLDAAGLLLGLASGAAEPPSGPPAVTAVTATAKVNPTPPTEARIRLFIDIDRSSLLVTLTACPCIACLYVSSPVTVLLRLNIAGQDKEVMKIPYKITSGQFHAQAACATIPSQGEVHD